MAAIDPVALTQRLIGFNTINPPGNEADCIEYLAGLLSGLGFETAIHPYRPGRSNLIATLGSNADVPGLCFSGHVDTVPLGQQQWTQDPFAGKAVGDRLYGRGSSDMKAGIAAFIAACSDLARRDWNNRGPLTILLTCGEETGCEGAAAVATAHLCKPQTLLVIAEPTSNLPVIGHKGVAWYKATLKGKTAHGSMPHEGINAAVRAAEFVCRLDDVSLGDEHPHLGRTTMNVGTFHAGLNINSVPDRAEVCLDCRTVPGLDENALRSGISHLLRSDDELEVLLRLGAVWSNHDGHWIKTVIDACRKQLGEQIDWTVAPYFTDAAVLQPAMQTPQTVILGPGHAEIAHKVDEWCSIVRIKDAVEIYRNIVESWLTHEGSLASS
jgi:succinyl-diaminopimelate desuccinylase